MKVSIYLNRRVFVMSINWSIIICEMIYSSGSLSGYLDEHKKLFFERTQKVVLDGVCSEPFLVFPRVLC